MLEPFFFVCLLAAVPVLVTTLPPMVDLPQHAAQVAMLQEVLSGTSPFAALLEVQLFTPYWLGYSLLFALARLMGVARAATVLVALTTVAFAWSASRFVARAQVAPHWRWLLVPLPFGFAYEWGFLNFLVAVPLGFAFLAHLRPDARERSARDVLVIVVWVHALFFAHVLVMAYFVAVAVLLSYAPSPREWLRRVAPLTSVAPVLVAWVLLKRATAGEVRMPPVWRWSTGRLDALPSTCFSLPFADRFTALALVLAVLPLLFGYRIRRSVAALAPFAPYVAVMLFGPQIAFGTSFVCERFGYVGLPLLALAFEEAPVRGFALRGRRALEPIYAVVAMLLLTAHVRKALAYEEESAPFREVVAHAEPGQRMLGLPFLRSAAGYAAPTYLHYATWYSSLRGGLAEFSFATYFPQVVRYRADVRPLATDRVNWAPELFAWSAWRGERYRYFLARQAYDPERELFPRGAVHLVAARGGWWLFEANESAP